MSRSKEYKRGYSDGYRAGKRKSNAPKRKPELIYGLTEGNIAVAKMQILRFGASVKEVARQMKVTPKQLREAFEKYPNIKSYDGVNYENHKLVEDAK